ncbi:bacteriocin immunity protein [Lysinibacillus xylanilyticus]|uniref:Bacteriocin immunity protein n=1 Tax=Lysinibacillus xylanilyticus TaxID=582475 RepID=A0ABV3VXN4_9BACI
MTKELIMAERKLNREELIVLVTRIMNAEFKTEAEDDQLLEEFLDNVIDPEAVNYIFYDNLLPEEVVDKALSYKPIRL